MSFLQTKDWVDFQKSIGRKVFGYDKDHIKASIIRHDIPFGKNYLYIPHGPEIDFNQMHGGFKAPIQRFRGYLKEIARDQKSIFIKVEPLFDHVAQALAESGFKKAKKQVQPHKTIVIDLAKSEDDLLSAMSHKTRYNIKIARQKNLQFKLMDSASFDESWKLFSHTSEKKQFHTHERGYYENLLGFNFQEISVFQAGVFLKDSLIAVAIFLIYKDTAYYLHGASDYEHRALMAPYLLHWEIIKHFKSEEVKNYDMWGIDANRWPGVTRFKLGWGGRQIEYPGSFDLTTNWFWNFMYKGFQTVRRD